MRSGIFPLPRFCASPARPSKGGHSRTRQRRRAGRIRESNQVMGRLETLLSGRLKEELREVAVQRPTHCGRSVRVDAAAEVWRAVCSHDPPLQPREGVDAISQIAEGFNSYAGMDRGDVVGKDEAFAEWMSLPSGELGSFEVKRNLGEKYRSRYSAIGNVLENPKDAEMMAAETNAFMGLHPEQYALLVARMLRIGMAKLKGKVKVVNGVFGVWKERPEREREECEES